MTVLGGLSWVTALSSMHPPSLLTGQMRQTGMEEGERGCEKASTRRRRWGADLSKRVLGLELAYPRVSARCLDLLDDLLDGDDSDTLSDGVRKHS